MPVAESRLLKLSSSEETAVEDGVVEAVEPVELEAVELEAVELEGVELEGVAETDWLNFSSSFCSCPPPPCPW